VLYSFPTSFGNYDVNGYDSTAAATLSGQQNSPVRKRYVQYTALWRHRAGTVDLPQPAGADG
jgi:hypothetical protein